MIQVNDDMQTVTSSLSLPEQSTTPIRHLVYQTSCTQFPKSRTKQLTPKTIAIPSNPMPDSPLAKVTSSNHSSNNKLSNATYSTLPPSIPEYTIFDPLKHLSHYPTYNLHPIDFSYQPKWWYPEAEFWNCPAIGITDCLIPRELSVALQSDFPFTVHIEGEFDGIPICLKLDPLHSTDLEPFWHGTVIRYKESNDVGKYMVECCQLVCEGVAYLKVVYHTSSKAIFPAYDKKRLTFHFFSFSGYASAMSFLWSLHIFFLCMHPFALMFCPFLSIFGH